ncbi:LPP20 family lipoprotein [Oceanobacter mangrovi]|uniref:LPP20 family lipoprotein n=1 Tax=Oceanobacter mangrovi TaxID=2862510 RepID=UPI001C8D9469|nr:LPP20 family lipoprotein [Oceanobacter mangrovi]
MTACVASPVQNARPDWIDHPADGVVASCRTHAKGRAAQEECAIQRARARLAAEQGVVISQQTLTQEAVRNGTSSSAMDQQTRQQIVNQTVKSRLIDSWYDPLTDEFFVYMERVR